MVIVCSSLYSAIAEILYYLNCYRLDTVYLFCYKGNNLQNFFLRKYI